MSYEPRCKMVYFDRNLIVDMLNGFKAGAIIRLPVTEGIPADTHVESLSYDISRKALCAVLWNKNWPIVPNGERFPQVDGGYLNREMFIRMPVMPLTSERVANIDDRGATLAWSYMPGDEQLPAEMLRLRRLQTRARARRDQLW